MSAIFGVYNLHGKPVSTSVLEAMSKIMSHRGSDATGVWTEANVGFGHRMLCTTQESLTEKLPKTIQGGDLTITADARIDNRKELLAELKVDSSKESISDSEVILLAYEKWGEDCTTKLIGDFAFAIWNKRTKSIFCARDHFGVKPFYYYHSKNIFAFSTEIKALFCVEEIPRKLNEVRLGDLLTSDYDDLSGTFYENVLRLPGSNQLTVSRDGKKIKTYWSLDPSRELRLSSDEEYAEKFLELFTEAVKCRMRSVYPVGSMLSGGLDSSSIACTAQKLMLEDSELIPQNNQELHTFSAVFESIKSSDESAYITAVLGKGNFQPHYLVADDVSPMADLEKVLWHLDGAIQVGNLYVLWHLFQTAQKNGVRVVLDGFDGDTTVSHGKMYLLELAQSQKWGKLLREIVGYSKNFEESAAALSWAYYWRFGIEPKLPKNGLTAPIRKIGQKLYKYSLTKDKYRPHRADQYLINLNSSFKERIKLTEHQKAMKSRLPPAPKTEREDHYLQFLKGVSPWILQTANNASAAFGVEVRYPFWDIRLAEYCLSLPPDQKMFKGYTRMVMRRAMKNILPEKVRWRPGKSDLSPAFDSGLLKFEKDRIEKTLEVAPSVLEKYYDVSQLPGMYTRLMAKEASEADVIKLSSSISLALWLQKANLTD